MAFSQDFDPTKGYVALPCDVMDIEMSPGGFRLLVELCRMANRDGECWPSLGQLSERIGRSKAAISGYISELRALELISTLNQKMANGYNYRLKYCVTFWQKWRAKLSAPRPVIDAKKTERSVQPVECRVNSKNHIQEKQLTHEPIAIDTDHPQLVSVFSKWSELSRRAPFPQFNADVPSNLPRETRDILATGQPAALTSDQLKTSLKALWKTHGAACTPSDLAQQAEFLVKQKTTGNGMKHLQQEVLGTWQKHWRKAPTFDQFRDMATDAQKKNRTEGMLRMLEQYLRRWELSRNKLQPTATSLNLTLKHAA
jgi:hypothetical protein